MGHHPRKLEEIPYTIEELARRVANLTYDQTAKFTKIFSEEIKRQSELDFYRGRKTLAAQLLPVAKSLEDANEGLESAWRICEPYESKKD